jgi:hypothetical protein
LAAPEADAFVFTFARQKHAADQLNDPTQYENSGDENYGEQEFLAVRAIQAYQPDSEQLDRALRPNELQPIRHEFAP